MLVSSGHPFLDEPKCNIVLTIGSMPSSASLKPPAIVPFIPPVPDSLIREWTFSTSNSWCRLKPHCRLKKPHATPVNERKSGQRMTTHHHAHYFPWETHGFSMFFSGNPWVFHIFPHPLRSRSKSQATHRRSARCSDERSSSRRP